MLNKIIMLNKCGYLLHLHPQHHQPQWASAEENRKHTLKDINTKHKMFNFMAAPEINITIQ